MTESEEDLRAQLEEARATIAALQSQLAARDAELASLREQKHSKADASEAFEQVGAFVSSARSRL